MSVGRQPRPSDESFAELVRPELSRLLRAAMLLCGDWQLAEDLVQTVLAKVFAAGRWADIQHPYDYLRRSVLNEYLAHRRRRSSTEVRSGEVDEGAYGAWEDSDPAARIDLMNALAQLSRLDRAVLVLRFYEDLSVADTAALLGLGPGAVRTRAGRALVRLRTIVHLESSPAEARESIGRSSS